MARKAKAGAGARTRKTVTARDTRRGGPLPPYGDPIRGAIESGDVGAMRRVAADARKWLAQTEAQVKTVRSALDTLEKKITDLGR